VVCCCLYLACIYVHGLLEYGVFRKLIQIWLVVYAIIWKRAEAQCKRHMKISDRLQLFLYCSTWCPKSTRSIETRATRPYITRGLHLPAAQPRRSNGAAASRGSKRKEEMKRVRCRPGWAWLPMRLLLMPRSPAFLALEHKTCAAINRSLTSNRTLRSSQQRYFTVPRLHSTVPTIRQQPPTSALPRP
jgi:hypothetical protein